MVQIWPGGGPWGAPRVRSGPPIVPTGLTGARDSSVGFVPAAAASIAGPGGSRSTRSGVACRADWCRFGQAAALGALQGCQAAHQQRPRAWQGHKTALWGLFPRRVRVGVRVRAKKRESFNHRKSRKYRKFPFAGRERIFLVESIPKHLGVALRGAALCVCCDLGGRLRSTTEKPLFSLDFKMMPLR